METGQTTNQGRNQPPGSLSEVFATTLILGASVSAATLNRNPTQLFLKRIGVLGGARTLARNGTPGAKLLTGLKKSTFEGVSAVIAIDLFFWDSVAGWGDLKEGAAYLRGLFKELRARSLPIVIGRIPDFHPLQIYRSDLNEAIEKQVAEHRAVGLRASCLPLDTLFREVMADGGLHIDGRHHRLEDLIPDGLHPGPVAAEFLSRELEKSARLLMDAPPEGAK